MKIGTAIDIQQAEKKYAKNQHEKDIIGKLDRVCRIFCLRKITVTPLSVLATTALSVWHPFVSFPDSTDSGVESRPSESTSTLYSCRQHDEPHWVTHYNGDLGTRVQYLAFRSLAS